MRGFIYLMAIIGLLTVASHPLARKVAHAGIRLGWQAGSALSREMAQPASGETVLAVSTAVPVGADITALLPSATEVAEPVTVPEIADDAVKKTEAKEVPAEEDVHALEDAERGKVLAIYAQEEQKAPGDN